MWAREGNGKWPVNSRGRLGQGTGVGAEFWGGAEWEGRRRRQTEDPGALNHPPTPFSACLSLCLPPFCFFSQTGEVEREN